MTYVCKCGQKILVEWVRNGLDYYPTFWAGDTAIYQYDTCPKCGEHLDRELVQEATAEILKG